jgi:hypothetical protein
MHVLICKSINAVTCSLGCKWPHLWADLWLELYRCEHQYSVPLVFLLPTGHTLVESTSFTRPFYDVELTWNICWVDVCPQSVDSNISWTDACNTGIVVSVNRLWDKTTRPTARPTVWLQSEQQATLGPWPEGSWPGRERAVCWSHSLVYWRPQV